jgi:manganese transport protein
MFTATSTSSGRLPTPTLPRSAGRSVRRATAILGPALIASIAYVDPGNISANIRAGSETQYRLLWVVVACGPIGLGAQYLSAKLGLATARTLPEVCRDHLRPSALWFLWLQAEVVAAATDLAEFVGAALGLNLLAGVPLPAAGVLVAVATFVILGVQVRGQRRLEVVIGVLLLVVVLGFVGDYLALGSHPVGAIAAGLSPSLEGGSATALAVGIVGATVMPHAIYLHSALTTRQHPGNSPRSRRTLLRHLRIDCAVGLGAAGLTNVVMLLVAVAVFAQAPGTADSIVGVHHALGTLLGPPAAAVFGVALLASGLAASSVGTFAGDVVMTGFVHRRIPLPLRRALTTSPALGVLFTGLPVTSVLTISQEVLSFGIPFALIPLVRMTASAEVMGDLVNRRATTVAATTACALVVGLNLFLVLQLIDP